MRNVAETQLESFALTDLPKRRREVYELVQAAPDGLTTHEVAEALEVQDHVVSGRLSELLNRGFVFFRETAWNGTTKRRIRIWEAV